MKYVCLGYMDPTKWETMSDGERNAFVDECFAYDDELRKDRHFVGGEALQGPQHAVTLRYQNGKVSITYGPFAETREQLGGYFLVDAKNLDEAIEWVKRCPNPHEGDSEIEIRQVFEAEDFDPEFTPDLREQEERLLAQVAERR